MDKSYFQSQSRIQKNRQQDNLLKIQLLQLQQADFFFHSLSYQLRHQNPSFLMPVRQFFSLFVFRDFLFQFIIVWNHFTRIASQSVLFNIFQQYKQEIKLRVCLELFIIKLKMKNQSNTSQYQHESEAEDYADYGQQGYHPVVLGQKFNHTYTVVQKLGWGHFSTVWLVHNQNTKQYGALKIQRSKQSHSQSAIDQMKILNQIRRHEKDPKWIQQLESVQKQHPELVNAKLCRPLLLFDNFVHHGIHGKHHCSVFQILGPNLLDLIQHYQFKDERMPLWLVKKITIDVLLGLVYLHEHCDIIHTDLKPENIMIKMEEEQEKQFIENIKKYKVKPLSMKYLKNLQGAKSNKSKKKNEKKKLKKKLKKQGQKAEQGQEQNQEQAEQSSSAQTENKKNQKEQSQKIESVINAESQKKVNQMSQQPQKPSEMANNSEEFQSISEKKQEEVDMKFLKWKNVKIELNKKLFFKIVDMGNACFASHHFTEDIQTREYRSPEVILGYSYAHNCDVWSLACTVYEMLTNNFLFKPKIIQGISKDEDHLYKIIQVLGPMSKQFALGGNYSTQFFNKKGKLLHGHPKQHVRLSALLKDDFGYSEQESVQIEQFLLPMLEIEDSKRASARQSLKHEWLWK